MNTKHSQKKINTMEHHDMVVCKLNTKHSKNDNKMNERHVKVIGQLHSQQSKQEMMKSTNNVNQVNKLTSQLTSTKSQLINQKELFHSAKVARRQVLQEASSQKENLKVISIISMYGS